jgi:hypothetical protein
MRVFRAAAIIALLTGPAYAQSAPPVPRYGDVATPKSPQEIENDKEAERAYKNSLGNIPDKGPTDPWGSTRSVDAPKTTAKATAKTAPAKRTKTGSTAN